MSRIVIIGEAWGRHEDEQKKPFVGPTGSELNRLLEEASLLPEGSSREISRNAYRRDEIYWNAGIHLTNVFQFRPQDNKLENICGPKLSGSLSKWSTMPAIKAGKYILEKYHTELDRLNRELETHRPNLIIGMGAIAQWFLLRSSAITRRRGTVSPSEYGKVITTFHPAYLMRGSWDLRPVVVFDLLKAARESAFPEIRRPRRFVYIPESLYDIEKLLPQIASASSLSVDIETFRDQITCIGFAWSTQYSLVIPIFHGQRSYWNTTDDERAAWRLIARILDMPMPKLFQNGLYDIRFLWQQYHITCRNCQNDTMLLHHALQPEVQKGLGFLGSIYTDEPAWKLMRPKGKGTIKREDE